MAKPSLSFREHRGVNIPVTQYDASNRAVTRAIDGLQGIRPNQFNSGRDYADVVARTIKEAAGSEGLRAGELRPEHQRVLEAVVKDIGVKVARGSNLRDVDPEELQNGIDRGVPWRPSSKGKEAFRDRRILNHGEDPLSAEERRAFEINREQKRDSGQGVRPGAVAPAGTFAPASILQDEYKRTKFVTKKLEGFGLSTTTARKLAEEIPGLLDADGRIKKDVLIDARQLNLSTPTMGHLEAAGFSNLRQKSKDVAGGFTSRELITGRPSGGDAGSSRAEKRRGFFRRRTVYEADSKGNVVGRELEPRITGKGVAEKIRNGTTNAFRSNYEASKQRREEKRLRNPFHRINRAEQVVRNERLIQLEGEYRNSTGLKQRYKSLQLKIFKWTLINRAWLSFVLLASILFVPWIGVLTWVGWALAAVAITIVKSGAFVLVNMYNLGASIAVSGINFVGNLVSGGIEALTLRVLDTFGLSATACTGEGTTGSCSRIFSYTVSAVDTTFPGFPEVAAPTEFDGRTLIDVILSLFGIQFSLADQIRRVLRGS